MLCPKSRVLFSLPLLPQASPKAGRAERQVGEFAVEIKSVDAYNARNLDMTFI